MLGSVDLFLKKNLTYELICNSHNNISTQTPWRARKFLTSTLCWTEYLWDPNAYLQNDAFYNSAIPLLVSGFIDGFQAAADEVDL